MQSHRMIGHSRKREPLSFAGRDEFPNNHQPFPHPQTIFYAFAQQNRMSSPQPTKKPITQIYCNHWTFNHPPGGYPSERRTMQNRSRLIVTLSTRRLLSLRSGLLVVG